MAAAVACGVAASGATTTACTTHQCDSDFVNIDQTAGTLVGELDPPVAGYTTWESGPIDGDWIDFPPARTYFFEFPPGFTPTGPPLPYVGTGPDPTTPGDGGQSYVLGGGQLAEFGPYVNGGFLVSNGTCAEYYLWLSVPGIYTPPPPPAADDAGASE
jgi:hypothetical protein